MGRNLWHLRLCYPEEMFRSCVCKVRADMLFGLWFGLFLCAELFVVTEWPVL